MASCWTQELIWERVSDGEAGYICIKPRLLITACAAATMNEMSREAYNYLV